MIAKFSKLTESSGSVKKISIDIHGVIDALPEFFAFLTDSFIKNGGEVHIVTGGSWTPELITQLNSYKIKWTHHFSVYDYLVNSNAKTKGEIQFPDGTVQKKFENSDWDSVKADYCLKHSIDFHIDDTLAYNQYFKTPFARLWTHNNNPKSSHKDLRHID